MASDTFWTHKCGQTPFRADFALVLSSGWNRAKWCPPLFVSGGESRFWCSILVLRPGNEFEQCQSPKSGVAIDRDGASSHCYRPRSARGQTCPTWDTAFRRIRHRLDGRRMERSRHFGELPWRYARRYHRVPRVCARYAELGKAATAPRPWTATPIFSPAAGISSSIQFAHAWRPTLAIILGQAIARTLSVPRTGWVSDHRLYRMLGTTAAERQAAYWLRNEASQRVCEAGAPQGW